MVEVAFPEWHHTMENLVAEKCLAHHCWCCYYYFTFQDELSNVWAMRVMKVKRNCQRWERKKRRS